MCARPFKRSEDKTGQEAWFPLLLWPIVADIEKASTYRDHMDEIMETAIDLAEKVRTE